MKSRRGTLLTLGALCLLTAGCETTPPYATDPGPRVKRELVLVPAEQAQLYSPAPSDANEAKPPPLSKIGSFAVETAPPITAIQLNRFQDPGDPDLLHEAHIVYRREGMPRWRLRPASVDQSILVGPQIADSRGEIQPVVSQELDAYLHEQRAFLAKQQQVMSSIGETLTALSSQQRQLALEVAKANAARTPLPPAAVAAEPGDEPNSH